MPRKRIEQRTDIPYVTRYHVWEECGKICAHCGKHVMIGANFTLEHVIPLHKGGKNELRNYVSLCKDCNSAKSDNVIEPIDYYPYLPDDKKADLQKLFNEYLETTNWLARDNVFKTDCFDITVPFPVISQKSPTTVFIPAKMRIERITSEEAFAFLFPYTARLRTEDKCLMVSSEEGLNTPYYKVLHHGTPIMYFTAYIDKPNWTKNENNEKNAVQIRIFANPELKDRKHTTDIALANVVNTITHYIQETLIQIQRGSTIECQILTPSSDKFAARAMYALSEYLKDHCANIEMSDNPDDPTAGKAIGINMILFQGNYQDLMRVTKEAGYKSPKELSLHHERGSRQEDIEKEIEQSVQFKEHRKKPHKNQTKKNQRSHKRKRHNK